MYKYAGVIVNNPSSEVDNIFTYEIPKELVERVKIGSIVKVPFGRGNKNIIAFVLNLSCEYDSSFTIKKIYSVCDDLPNLRLQDIELIKLMRKKYLCTYLDCINTIIPSQITNGIKNKINHVIYCGDVLDGKFLKEPYTKIYSVVKQYNGIFNKNVLSRKFNLSLSSINTMIKYGFLKTDEIVVQRYDSKKYKIYAEKVLNDDQKNAVLQILNSQKKEFLIHGVTGSGKTEIYMHLVGKMIEKGLDSIILVPEISLTPQIIEIFKGRFGKDIAVFHSRLSDGEKYDEWMRVRCGKVKVAIGARSALFLPFKKLGLIVIDEEHESSYKSDSNPKYNAKEVAHMKSEIEGCKVVLGSATPCVETYYNCKVGKIDLITIDKRADGAQMPEIDIVDMRRELINNNKSIFSEKLYRGMEERIKDKEQIILFLNRRGFSNFVSCRKCGYVFKCSNCDISLTYHASGNFLSCHYCGKRRVVPKICPKCGSRYVKYFGVGTEKVESETKKLFPNARILRMDYDTTRSKNSYTNIYNSFKNGDADILIGTQMIAKGFDFKNVTLVGVIAADISLNLPDYRCAERTFQLVSQVAGRAGRGKIPGKVIVQTYNPDNYSIIYASKGDYKSFFDEEITLRKNMNYPPFSKILCISLSSKNEDILIKNSIDLGNFLKKNISSEHDIKMLGPSPCAISKIKSFYRWKILFKGRFDNIFEWKIKKIIYGFLKNIYNDIRISIDINPTNLL